MRVGIRFIWVLLVVCTSMGQAQVSIGTGSDTLLIGKAHGVTLELSVPQESIASIDFSSWQELSNLLYDIDSTRAEKTFDAAMIGSEDLGIAKGQWQISGDQLKAMSGKVYVAFYTYGYGKLPTPKVILKNGKAVPPRESRIIIVDVPGGLEEQGMEIQLEDLKDIIREPVSWTDYLGYIGVLLGLVGLVLLFRWVLSRRSTEVEADEVYEEVVIVPAHIKAKAALQELEGKQLWQTGQEKEYHSELTSIMRSYLDDRYELPAMELTTSQIQRQLQELEIDRKLTADMVDLLQIADKVKFAKGVTGDDINKQFMIMAYNWVDQTKQALQTDTI